MPKFTRDPLPSFLYLLCQVGAETVVKRELSREHPSLKFAYSRPGFITFKDTEGKVCPDFELRSVFARAYGLSLIKMKNDSSTEEWIEKITLQLRQFLKDYNAFHIHIYEKEQYLPDEEPLGFVRGKLRGMAINAIQSELQIQDPNLKFELNQIPRTGERVLDLIIIDEKEWWIGLHTHSVHHSPFPGGASGVELHPEAPSRAYVKLEEALKWSGALLKQGDTAVEVGSAPGGASFSLLQRGLNVVGVDPAKMDSRVLKSPQFKHIQKPVAAVYEEDLPSSVQWLLLDMNVTPAVSLYAVDRLVTRYLKDSLLGLLLTVKLNQWKIADEIPSMIKHIYSMGMVRVKATQLPNNKQEIFIYALTRKGKLRR